MKAEAVVAAIKGEEEAKASAAAMAEEHRSVVDALRAVNEENQQLKLQAEVQRLLNEKRSHSARHTPAPRTPEGTVAKQFDGDRLWHLDERKILCA